MHNLQLKVCEYNIENLFISMDYHNGEDLHTLSEEEWKGLALAQFRRKQKPLAKLWGLRKAILDIDADILMLVEVGGGDSLDHFSHYFLDDAYIPHYIEGNSRRNINLGFLVKRGLPFRFETVSNKEKQIEVEAYQGKYFTRFSRDVAELRVHDDSGLKLILLLTHLKSKISSDQDYQGNDVRAAEAIALAEIYENLRLRFPEVPILLGGDFNAELSSPEFTRLNQTDLIDFHELLQTPKEERISLVHFDYYKTAHTQILDYILISPHLKGRVIASGSYTYRYKGFYDIPDELPATPKERYLMPSDHYPVVVTLSLAS